MSNIRVVNSGPDTIKVTVNEIPKINVSVTSSSAINIEPGITSAERNKLAGIEAGATADLTASEVKTLYESNSDTNALTDANNTKLGYISIGNNRDIDVMNAAILVNNEKPYRIQPISTAGGIYLDHRDISNTSFDPVLRPKIPDAATTNAGVVTPNAQTFGGLKTFNDGLAGNLSGNVTGDVTGNVTGDVTGNVTGDLTGNADTVTNGVYTTGNQTIGGNKTFSGTTTLGTTIAGSIATTGSVSILNSQSLSVTGTLGVTGTSSFGGDASFTADLLASGLKFTGSGTNTIGPSGTGGSQDDLEIQSNGNVTVKLDSDNDESGQKFKVVNNSGAEKFSVDEDGNVEVHAKIISATDRDIDIEPGGAGDVLLGNFKFDADQSVGSGQDNYVLTYDDSTGKISLEAATGGGGGGASALNDLSDVSTSGVSNGDVLVANVSGNFSPSSNLQDLVTMLKSGSTTTLTSVGDGTSTDKGVLNLGASSASLKYNTTGITIDEASPGDIEFIVATDASGSTAFTAVHIDGTTTANAADVIIKNGSNLKIESSSASASLRYTGSGNANITLPSSTGTLALTTDTDLSNDTTPQLGGNLDVNGNDIVSTSDGHIVLDPNGTGEVRLDKATGDAVLQVNHITNGNNSRLELTEGNGTYGAFFNYDSTIAHIGSINGSSDVNSIKINRPGDMEFLKSVKFLSPAVFEMTVDNDATNFPIELKDENSQTQVFYLKNSGVADEVDMYLKGDSQITGNLEVQGDIVSTSNADIDLDPNGTGKVVFKGNSDKGAGQFVLNCEQNSHGVVIKGPPHSAAASYTLTLPNTDGSANQVLKTDGSGNLDWVAQTTDTNTQNTTTLSFVDSTDDIILRNTTGGAGSGTQDIKFVAGSNITLTHTDADNITIAASGSGGSSTFVGLSDTPGSFTASKFLKVNSAGDAIEFVDSTSAAASTEAQFVTQSTAVDAAGEAEGTIVKFGDDSTTAGKVYTFSSGTWVEVDANDEAKTKGLLAMALGGNSTTNGMLVHGVGYLNHNPGSAGDILYISHSATGQISSTQPSDSADFVRVVGHCLASNKVFFSPSQDYIDLA